MYKVFDLEGPCDEFAGCRDHRGYGMKRRAGKVRRTHILAWEDAYGPVPTVMCVCHRCDNPPCRNLKHLFLGTKGQNNRDRADKGRSADCKGERHNQAVLTDEQVSDIKRRLKINPRGIGSALARYYGVSPSTISLIKLGKHWQHVQGI